MVAGDVPVTTRPFVGGYDGGPPPTPYGGVAVDANEYGASRAPPPPPSSTAARPASRPIRPLARVPRRPAFGDDLDAELPRHQSDAALAYARREADAAIAETLARNHRATSYYPR